ncbi:hypothetical protein MSAN_02440500 [Mycena sanguinolenta]|uniref:Uncharacterized protein n=1 Tax=Mycena sanguinolenta TaxID=230812 RepID=A0A8H6WYV0_9AGAR|nr:hypothetical protein MSAN_02440500 [Mycena sanguinolenta]
MFYKKAASKTAIWRWPSIHDCCIGHGILSRALPAVAYTRVHVHAAYHVCITRALDPTIDAIPCPATAAKVTPV